LELGSGAEGQKTRMMGLLGQQISLTIYSAIWTECMNVTDRQTDGIQIGLLIASHGKNSIQYN